MLIGRHNIQVKWKQFIGHDGSLLSKLIVKTQCFNNRASSRGLVAQDIFSAASCLADDCLNHICT